MAKHAFLSGGGEMGARIRAHDWAATPLGPPETWPPALRTALSICLHSSFPTVIYWGPELRALYNDAWISFPAERHPWALGQRAQDIWADIWPMVGPQFEQVVATGEGFSAFDYMLPIRRGGNVTETYRSYSLSPIRGDDGAVAGVLAQGYETTARIVAERDRARETGQLREMFAQAPGAVAILRGPDHVFEIANAAALDLIGSRDVIGRPVAEVMRGVVDPGLIALLDKVYRSGEPHVGTAVPLTLRRGPDGAPEERILDFVYQPIRSAAGAVTGIFIAATDVTARARAEARFRRVEETLRESEARFRLIADGAPVMLWMGDEAGKCIYLNRMLRDFWNVGEADLPTFDWTATVHPDDRATLFRAFDRGMRTRTGFTVEARFRRADGAYRIVNTQAQPRFGVGGEFLGMIGVNVDVTETRRVEAELQALNATLEQRVAEEVAERSKAEEALRQSQKMEALGQLTGGIAHDFNNMLAVILGGLNLLKRRIERGDTNLSTYIEGAMDGAQRAAALTQRLLAFSRQQPLAPEPIDANGMVADMTELLARTLGEAITIETVLAEGLWKAKADPNQLENAIINLAVNARDAMPDGGRLTIETANTFVDDAYAREFAIPPGQYVLIAVSDTGVGMARDVIAKAFDPFFTTKGVGKGTGLGLSQVFGFVRQSGGHVKIHSELGQGTTISLYLPRVQAEEGVKEQPPAELERGSGDEIVMVVEDEERVRAYSVETLRELGYTVLDMPNAREAMELIERGQSVTLLFTDVVMPDMTGPQLAERALQQLPNLKVLYTTGYTPDEAVHSGVLGTGTNLLPKPFGMEELAAKVRGILDQ